MFRDFIRLFYLRGPALFFSILGVFGWAKFFWAGPRGRSFFGCPNFGKKGGILKGFFLFRESPPQKASATNPNPAALNFTNLWLRGFALGIFPLGGVVFSWVAFFPLFYSIVSIGRLNFWAQSAARVRAGGDKNGFVNQVADPTGRDQEKVAQRLVFLDGIASLAIRYAGARGWELLIREPPQVLGGARTNFQRSGVDPPTGTGCNFALIGRKNRGRLFAGGEWTGGRFGLRSLISAALIIFRLRRGGPYAVLPNGSGLEGSFWCQGGINV